MSSSDLISLPSEPPEIRNWFSSYEYESPALDSNENPGDLVPDGSSKDKIFINENERENENVGGFQEIRKKLIGFDDEKVSSDAAFKGDKSENQSSSKDADFSCSSLLISEPIDIKNWFSSYVYESPFLEASDSLRDFGEERNTFEKDGFVAETSRGGKSHDFGEYGKGSNDKEVVANIVNSKGPVNCNGSQGENMIAEKNITVSDKSKMCFEGRLGESSDCETLLNHSIISPDTDVEKLCSDDIKCTPSFSCENGCTLSSIKRGSCSPDGSSSEKLKKRVELFQEGLEIKRLEPSGYLLPESSSKSMVVSGDLLKKSIHGCNSNEDDRKEKLSNGFVATKKHRYSRANDENFLQIPKQSKEKIVSLAGGMDSDVKRLPLEEKTNFHLSSVIGITGKWKCPQKSKPNLGPPLKQLRLERWVRKI